MLFQFITNIFCLSEPGEHILHRVGDLWREKTTEFSRSLRTSKIWFGSLTGMEQSWLRFPAAAWAQKGHQDQESERAETPRRPFLLPLPGHPSDPQLNSNPLIPHAPQRNCSQTDAFPSDPTGKHSCQNNFPKAGSERRTIKAAMSQ